LDYGDAHCVVVMGVGLVAELRISDVPVGSAGRRRVEVMWQDGAARRVAVAEVAGLPGGGEGERVRWYLEEYAEFPADPAPAVARQAEAQLAQAGVGLFRAVFADVDAVGIWERARDRLGQVRVEVEADPGEGPGLAWELLRDPGRDAPVALDAGAFVRTHLRAAGHPELPESAGDRLRVLLVIARPGGRDDVPFRSVASRLVRGGAERMKGLDLNVLRPATFARLSQVLHAANDAGRPYHVVHFDGHGDWLDPAALGAQPGEAGAGGGGAGGGIGLSPVMYGASVAGPVRPGQHGYLLFEEPTSEENQQLVDGPTLGRLLTGTGVPVLVLNACRSAYAEARNQPADTAGAEPGSTDAATAAGDNALTGDVHARVRAYGSLAAEVADTGVPGVGAMRYNVYVVTAAQFVADLYAHMLAGRSLGQAAAAARKALAADPVRQIGASPISLQDWAVPVVYEAAPLVLLRTPQRAVPVIKLTSAKTGADQDSAQAGGVPRPPDAGFFGRDETLLALDRAFDTQPVVLLHAFAGAGKSATAAEFARWYQATGGLNNPDHPEWVGAVLWTSFEHRLAADRLIGTAGDHFASLLEANGIAWAAVTDPGQRRDLVLQVLAQVPVLWIWDNVEPVAGFPEGTPSDWTQAEQDELATLLRDLAQQTRCKVLLTSRRDEHPWLGNLPARVQLPAMPMRESLQLAAALAARHDHTTAGVNWRPLLRYAAGNPLTITVLVGQALRDNLTTNEAIEGFVTHLRAGEAQLEAGEDAALGRTRSLAASLSYGFAQAFTHAERAKLAVLHLFRRALDVDALRYMGNPDKTGEDAVPELVALTREAGIALLDRAADIGLLTSLGGGYYHTHPALPWYFTALFTTTYGQASDASAQRATRAYTRAIGALGDYYLRLAEAGRESLVVPVLATEEANLRHALDLARTTGLWRAAVGCLQGLRVLYERTGRDGEWARLVAAITPDITDPATGGPLPGREEQWSVVTSYQVRLAWQTRDWPAAVTLQTVMIAWYRDRAAAALAAPPASLSPSQRSDIRNLGEALNELGVILRHQDDPGCLPILQEALELAQRIGDRVAEAQRALNLGNAYLSVPELRDLDQAERWYQRSLSVRSADDRLGRAQNLSSLGAVALERFDDGRAAGETKAVLLEHLSTAISSYRQSLDLAPADDHQARAIRENQLGVIYRRAGDTPEALRHYQQAIKHHEIRGDIYGAGQARFNIALLFADDGRVGDALQYARAALNNYQQAGPSAASGASNAEQLIADLEQRNGGQGDRAAPRWR
jgi:tetratricopeptide (TPR) repeat protein